ncbi:MAG TPA: GDSL-type esterase/lipase family protein [Acidimicrobiales bacterium]|nr:GDSL-type esterase/lipase family protein [Acidimicrobiales bacterium]
MQARTTSPGGPRPARLVALVLVALTLVGSLVVAVAVPARPVGAATTGPVPDPRLRVAFYGDSLGYNAEAELRSALEPTYAFTYRGAGGAAVEYWRPSILRRAHRPDPPDVLVIELGTADAGWAHSPERFERDVRDLLDEVSPLVPCIRWLDQREEPSYFFRVNKRAVAFNEILWRVASEYPNVEVVHYAHWATLSLERNVWWPDRLHHNAAGRREMAALVRQAVVGCDPSRTTGPFWDVPDDDPAEPAAAWMLAQGLVSPYPNGTFRSVVGGVRPTVTRAQAARFLWRLAGTPEGSPPHPWSDVPARHGAAVDWLTDLGALPGGADGRWAPRAPLTRAALVDALWRLAGRPEAASPGAWPDVPPELVAAFDWAAAEGLVAPLADGTARPLTPQARGKVARLLFAFATRDAEPPPSTTTTSTSAPSTTIPSTTIPPTTSTTPSSTSTSTSTPSASTTVPGG